MDFRRGRRCVFLLHAHLVFVTKYRKTIFSKKMLESLKDYFGKVCNDFSVVLVEFNGEKDHVHLLVNYSPKTSLSRLVNSLKGVSSRKLRQDYADAISSIYYRGVLWSPSYFAGSVSGASISVIRHSTPQGMGFTLYF